MNIAKWKMFLLTAGIVGISALPVQAEQVKDGHHPTVNGSPVTLMKDNYLTQTLGGRVVDLDVWAGEFIKYDDNIFNTHADQKTETVFATAAGVLLQAQQDDVWNVRAETQVQHNAYSKYDEFNGMEGFLHTQGSVKFSPALSANAMLNYDSTYDNIRDKQDIYDLDKITTGAGLSISPSPYMGIDVNYTYFTQMRDDKDVNWQEYDEHTFAVRPSYQITPNTTGYVLLSVGMTRPVENEKLNDSEQYSGVLGLSWRYKDTASVLAELGYKQMEFDDQVKHAGASSSYSNIIAHIKADYSFTSDWKSGVDFMYAPYYSGVSSSASGSNYIDRFNSSAFLTYSPGAGRFTATLKPYYTISKPENDTDSNEYGVNLGVSYVVTEWFNVNAGYTYSGTDYADQAAYDRNILTLGAALTF